MQRLLLVFFFLFLVGCSKFPGIKKYSDNKEEIEKHLAALYPELQDISCASNELIRYAEDFCDHFFKEDNLASFQECYRDGGSFANLQYTFYVITVFNCELGETNVRLKARLEEMSKETEELTKSVEQLGKSIENMTGP